MIVDYKRKLYHLDPQGNLFVVQFIPTDLNVLVKVWVNHIARDAVGFTADEARKQWIKLWDRGYRHNLMALNFAVGG